MSACAFLRRLSWAETFLYLSVVCTSKDQALSCLSWLFNKTDPVYCVTADPVFCITADPVYCITPDPVYCVMADPVYCITADRVHCVTADPVYCITEMLQVPFSGSTAHLHEYGSDILCDMEFEVFITNSIIWSFPIPFSFCRPQLK